MGLVSKLRLGLDAALPDANTLVPVAVKPADLVNELRFDGGKSTLEPGSSLCSVGFRLRFSVPWEALAGNDCPCEVAGVPC